MTRHDESASGEGSRKAGVNVVVPEKTDARFKFIATPDQVSEARALVEITLVSWALRYLVADAKLIVSELATNACAATPGQTVILVLAYEEGSVFIGVWDSSAKLPVMTMADPDDECGRGLSIVAMLTTDHGAHPVETGGKLVWGRLKT